MPRLLDWQETALKGLWLPLLFVGAKNSCIGQDSPSLNLGIDLLQLAHPKDKGFKGTWSPE
jgi:hypothetical protein